MLETMEIRGVEPHLHQLLGASAAAIRVTPRVFNFRYRLAAHRIEVFRARYGLLHKVVAALPTAQAFAAPG